MNLKTGIIGFDGKPYFDFLEKEGDIPENLTFGKVLAMVLITTQATDPLRTYLLTQKIAGKDEVELSAEENVYLKDLIKKNAESQAPTYNPHILGQSIFLLDKKDEKPE